MESFVGFSYIVFVQGLLLIATCSGDNAVIREKRNLVYTIRNSFIQLIIGTGVPVPIEGGQALTIGWVLKAYYGVPNNASYYTNPYVTFQRRAIEEQQASRFDLYRSIEDSYQIFGGKGCVLRAICETAHTPFKGSNILGLILHIIFSPSSTDEHASGPGDMEYEAAARLGSLQDAPCEQLFPECTNSLLDVITVAQ